jgi:hypothetical protein
MLQAFRRKSIAEIDAGFEQLLKRLPGAGDLVLLAIGSIIDAGIFGVIGTVKAWQIGPDGVVIRYDGGLVFSFLLFTGACALAPLCYAEREAMIPQAWTRFA